MVEIWVPFSSHVTAVFGEWGGRSPKKDVWIQFSGSVTAVFGECIGESPKTEVWMVLVDFLTSFFGDVFIFGAPKNSINRK